MPKLNDHSSFGPQCRSEMLEKCLYTCTPINECMYWGNKGHTAVVLVSRCFFFFVFFVLSARGKTTAKPWPLPPAEQGAECAHQPVWKPAFSRILPEGVTQRNPLQASAACWMLCRQPMDTVQGTLVRHLFKRTGDSNLDTSQAEGPNCSSTAWVESHNGTPQPGTILQNYALHLALYLAVTASRTPVHTKAPEACTPHDKHRCTPLLGSLPERTCRALSRTPRKANLDTNSLKATCSRDSLLHSRSP